MLVAAEKKYPRFNEAWEGLSWLIAHGGDKVGAVERKFGGVGHFMYTFAGDPEAGFPRIVVVYRWYPGRYVIRAVVICDPPAN